MRSRSPELTEKRKDKQKPRRESPKQREFLIAGITPHERANEFLEGRSEKTKDLGKREDAMHARFWPRLSADHETHARTKELLELILEKAGFPKDFLDLAIFDSAYPEAHVQLIAKRVRLSNTFLKVMKGDPEKIAAVLAHEVGHVLLAHYRERGDSFDPLNEHIQGYENEYQADRASVILTNRLGIKPSTLADALRTLESDLASRDTKDAYTPDDFDHHAWIFSTHPHAARRVAAIERDGASLPRYKKKSFQFDVIPLPKKEDFEVVDFKSWEPEAFDVYDYARFHPDCLWDEIEMPTEARVEDSVYDPDTKTHSKVRISGSARRMTKDYTNPHKEESPPFEVMPDQVNAWGKKDRVEIEKWWKQAMNALDSEDGYDDLSDDIRSYSLASTQLLLNHVAAEIGILTILDKSWDDVKQDDDVLKEYAKTQALSDPDHYHFKAEMMIVTSLLVRNWFEKDQSLATADGMRRFLQFSRDFKDDHGQYLPYSGARLHMRLEELFNSAQTDDERAVIADMCKEYRSEIGAGTNATLPLIDVLMPSITTWLDDKYPEIVFAHDEGPEGKTDLDKMLDKAAHDDTITPQHARDTLALVDRNYRPQNLTLLLTGVIREVLKEADESGHPDILLEANPVSSANYLSSEEFDRKYFGADREKYTKAKYAVLDSKIGEFKDVATLWEKAQYRSEFNKLPIGTEKLEFLLDTFRARSAQRDILVAEALGWDKIEFVEDVIATQEQILRVDDVSLLYTLTDVFSNPLLSLSVYQQLWTLYERSPQEFFQHVPKSEIERVEAEISAVAGKTDTERLKGILLAHREPSYVRDELLRPLVDRAPDQETTMALASWYCEPPPGVLRPRSGEVVAVTESILDTLRGMSSLDKQELFLYFMGQRLFYSGIEAYFFREQRREIEETRKDAIYTGRRPLMARTSPYDDLEDFEPDDLTDEERRQANEDIRRSESEDDDEEEEDDDIHYVSTPDPLIFLTKASGIPIEILTQQQRLTTTRREQREFITHLLLGNDGILKERDRGRFLSAVARNVVDNSTWSQQQTPEERKATVDLLGFALNRCPDQRLPDLFLGLWNLQQEKGSLPEIVTTLIRELGPLFIKGGQYLGTQSNTLPPEWIQAFRALSDQNQRAEKTLVYEHEYALYGDNSPFMRIGEKEGEGSMAAVYRGELKPEHSTTDPDVAIKIFHPNTQDNLTSDVAFLDALVKFVNSKRDEFKVRLPDNLGEVSQNQILKELSFDSILKNNADIAGVLSNSSASVSWRVPAIVRAQSNPEFIVSQYSHGVPLDTLPEETSSSIRSEVAAELLRQILLEGTYQGDPNPGNFKATVSSGGTLVDWLDTDHTGRFSSAETAQLRNFVMELFVGKNQERIADILNTFVQESEISSDELKTRIQGWLQDSGVLSGALLQNIEGIFISFLDFLADNKLVLKEQHVTLLRTLGLMKPLLADVKQEQLMPLMTALYTRMNS